MEIFIFFWWYMVWSCLPGFEPYFFWTFVDREQRCTHLHGPLPLAPSNSNPPRWTQQSYPLHTWTIRHIYCYFINYHLCYVLCMQSKFIVICYMCSSSKKYTIIKFSLIIYIVIEARSKIGEHWVLVCLSVYLSISPQPYIFWIRTIKR